jgi:hypothetical protein
VGITAITLQEAIENGDPIAFYAALPAAIERANATLRAIGIAPLTPVQVPVFSDLERREHAQNEELRRAAWCPKETG